MIRMCTHYADELRQRHLYGDGDLLALVDRWSDQLVVALWAQQGVDQPLLCVLGPAAFRHNTWREEHER